jgi:hypothetical protein
MSIQVAPFRTTDEDLAELDSKTREGLQPLLGALNITLQETVAAFANMPSISVMPVTLVTDTTAADSFPLVFKHNLGTTPRWVGMVCNPKDPAHVLTTAFVMQGFQLTDAGLVSVPWITGILPSSTYNLAFLLVG